MLDCVNTVMVEHCTIICYTVLQKAQSRFFYWLVFRILSRIFLNKGSRELRITVESTVQIFNRQCLYEFICTLSWCNGVLNIRIPDLTRFECRDEF